MRFTLQIPAGVVGDDTSFAEKGRWGACSLVRFRLGKPQVDGGWESLIGDLLTGVCRIAFPFRDNAGVLNVGFGTHSKLQLWQGGALYDITPFGPPARLGANPLATTSAAATVTVTQTAHGRTTGDSDIVAGALDTNGILAANLNGTRTITVTDADHFTFTAGAAATSTGSGGGTNVVVTPQVLLPAGAVDGTGTAGFGTGGYGGGPWGETPLTLDYFPRTWAMAAWGQNLLASPRGGGLYQWSNVTSAKAVAVTNAPTQMTHMLVAPLNGGYQAFALGTQEEVSGAFNPMCIRHSSIRNLTEWSTLASGSTAREYVLTGGGRIVAGRMIGPYMLVWTDDGLFLGSFVGDIAQPWRFDRVGRNCGLIGPNAAVVTGQRAVWISPDRQVFSYSLGGEPTPIACPIRSEFADNLAASQGDKIVASTSAEYGEVRFDYPDSRDGAENSRFIRVAVSGPDAGAWSGGVQARTAFVDAGPSAYPIGVTAAGNIYYHEIGNSADGGAFAWFIETADQLLDVNSRMLVRGLWPDFKGQVGPVTVTLTSREQPQGEETVTAADPMAPSDAKADLLVSGLLFRVRFAGSSAPTACRIGNPAFDVERAGQPLAA